MGKILAKSIDEGMKNLEVRLTELEEGLAMARRCAIHLKEKFPNEVLAIKDNTIISFCKENSRLIHGARKSMNGCYAFYTNHKPHRIVIQQKLLIEKSKPLKQNWYSLDPISYGGMYGNCRHRGLNVELYGESAIVEVMCHELAHHRTKGHAKGFKIKYQKFLKYMTSEILDGNYAISENDLVKFKTALEKFRKLKLKLARE